MQTLGIAGMSKSEVSRQRAALDGQVQAFLTRRLDTEYPYVYVDARYEHGREDKRVQSMGVQIAYGIRSDGVRKVSGLEVTGSEDLEHWRTFLQSLVARGGRGVRLVVSDSTWGSGRPSPRCSWEQAGNAVGCTSCATCSAMSPRAPKPGESELSSEVAATVRPIFQQQGRQEAQAQLAQVSALLAPRFP